MLAEALVWKYGYASGLTLINDTIAEWPSTWPARPSKTAIDKILADYKAQELPKAQARQGLDDGDKAMIRAVEDLFSVLKQKGLIADDDLSPAVLEKLAARHALRESLK